MQSTDYSSDLRKEAQRFKSTQQSTEVAKLPTGNWTEPLILNGFRFWADDVGKLRMKASNPTSALDGVVVGTQT